MTKSEWSGVCRRLLGTIALSSIAAGGVWAADVPPSGSKDVWKYLNGLPEAERIAVLEKQAAQEGTLTIYGALGIDRADILIKLFNEKYPNIKVDFVRLREPELVQRVTTEYRAGKPGGSVAISSVNWLAFMETELGGYEPTTWNQFDPAFRFGSAEQGWTAIAYEVLPSTIAWRTDRVNSEEAPRTLAEVANPKWKGRTGTTSHLEALIDGLNVALGDKEASALVDKLAALDNRLYPSIASLADALAQGEIDVAWNMGAHRSVRLKSQGAPIDFVMQDPLLGQGITVSVLEGGKHSYAAALFMELLTRADTLEKIDRAEGGRLFGNTKGTYQLDLSKLPPLTMFGAMSKERFAELGRIKESKFLRRR